MDRTETVSSAGTSVTGPAGIAPKTGHSCVAAVLALSVGTMRRGPRLPGWWMFR